MAVSFHDHGRLMDDSLTGQLLVASSFVTEPMYAAGVCLVVHQDDERVIGVMLNRPIKLAKAISAPSESEPSERPAESSDRFLISSDRPAASQQSRDTDNGAFSLAELGTDKPGAAILHFGGPVSGPVVAIHQSQQQAEAETAEGIYVAAQKHHLENLIRNDQACYRLIVGHLSWTPEKLQQEIDSGMWHPVPATSQTVFCRDQEMWARIIRRATSRSVSKWLGIPDAAHASELN